MSQEGVALNLEDLAKRAGLTKATTARAMNNHEFQAVMRRHLASKALGLMGASLDRIQAIVDGDEGETKDFLNAVGKIDGLYKTLNQYESVHADQAAEDAAKQFLAKLNELPVANATIRNADESSRMPRIGLSPEPERQDQGRGDPPD